MCGGPWLSPTGPAPEREAADGSAAAGACDGDDVVAATAASRRRSRRRRHKLVRDLDTFFDTEAAPYVQIEEGITLLNAD